MSVLSIDFETADRITRLTLTEHRDLLQYQLDEYYATQDSENPKWLHPEDVDKNYLMIKKMNYILEYYGGELYGECKARKYKESTSMVEASERLEAYFLEVGKKGAEESHSE